MTRAFAGGDMAAFGTLAVRGAAAARDWTFMQQYADAKTEVVEAIMRRAAPGHPA